MLETSTTGQMILGVESLLGPDRNTGTTPIPDPAFTPSLLLNPPRMIRQNADLQEQHGNDKRDADAANDAGASGAGEADVREQLAAAQAKLAQAAEEAADLRSRLTALSDAEEDRAAAKAEV